MNTKELCLSLLQADSAEQVEKLLADAGYLSDGNAWRPVADNYNNKGTVQNQQADAISSLAEKVTNSIDAVLMDKCLSMGIDPKGPSAPQNFTAAVGEFFFGRQTRYLKNLQTYMTADELKSLERYIFISATGTARNPSLTISDKGEGQSPGRFPKTFMALNGSGESGQYMESIKRSIPFLQGQFGMGGSGAYKYSTYQLLISRRNPALVNTHNDPRFDQWGFTVVRARKDPDGTIYEYLAPLRQNDSDVKGEVLSFSAETLPIMPESPPKTVPNKAYGQEVEYGTAIKLYEYRFEGTKSNITFADSLRAQVELAMPRLALPIRGVEARSNYKGEPASFQTSWFGVMARLEQEEKSKPDVFEGPPVLSSFTLRGKKIKWQAFVKKESFGGQNNRGKYAIIVHLNGQKHGVKSQHFLRKARLEIFQRKNTILVGVDASELNKLEQEELFMPSRDRFREDEQFAKDFFDALAEDLKSNDQLQAYARQQKAREQEAAVQDNKAANELLEKWLKQDALLSNFFGFGGKINTNNPAVRPNSGDGAGKSQFQGERFPTFLQFKNRKTDWKQSAQAGKSVRVAMITDAENDYLDRDLDKGRIRIFDSETERELENFGESLFNGALNLTIRELPKEQENEEVSLRIEMSDDTSVKPLVCNLTLSIVKPVDPESGTKGVREEPNKPKGDLGNESGLSAPKFHFFCNSDPKKQREGYIPWPEDSDWSPEKAAEMYLDSDQETQETEFHFNINADYKEIWAYRNQNPSDSAKMVEHKFAWSMSLLCLSAFEANLSAVPEAERSDMEASIVENINLHIAEKVGRVLLPTSDLLSNLDPKDFELGDE